MPFDSERTRRALAGPTGTELDGLIVADLRAHPVNIVVDDAVLPGSMVRAAMMSSWRSLSAIGRSPSKAGDWSSVREAGVASAIKDYLLIAEGVTSGVAPSDAEVRAYRQRQMDAMAAMSAPPDTASVTLGVSRDATDSMEGYRLLLTKRRMVARVMRGATTAEAARDAMTTWFAGILGKHRLTGSGVDLSTAALVAALRSSY